MRCPIPKPPGPAELYGLVDVDGDLNAVGEHGDFVPADEVAVTIVVRLRKEIGEVVELLGGFQADEIKFRKEGDFVSMTEGLRSLPSSRTVLPLTVLGEPQTARLA